MAGLGIIECKRGLIISLAVWILLGISRIHQTYDWLSYLAIAGIIMKILIESTPY